MRSTDIALSLGMLLCYGSVITGVAYALWSLGS